MLSLPLHLFSILDTVIQLCILEHVLELTVIFADDLSLLIFTCFNQLVLIIDASIGDKNLVVSDDRSIHDNRDVIPSTKSGHA